MGYWGRLALSLVVAVAAGLAAGGEGQSTSDYFRPDGQTVEMPLDADVFKVPPGYNAPQQVHITQGDYDGKAVIVSWVTPDEPGSSIVLYRTSEDLMWPAEGFYVQYTYYNYTSGFIHHCTLRDLTYDTKYYYTVGVGGVMRNFSFTTPPKPGPDVPYKFGIIGDLGQTYTSNVTLTHYQANGAQALLYVGDLSYADNYPFHDNVRWDTWGRFIERSVAYQPWIWVAGNHELDVDAALGEDEPYKPYRNRYATPYRASGSTAPFWYSIKQGPAYIIVLASYSAYGTYTPQYEWLQKEITKVNRSETPWLIFCFHDPWYNSYYNAYMEGETMRVQFESWLVKAKVDVVFSGHVHAYERTFRFSNILYNITNAKCTPVPDQSAPVYLTVGDGGNIEGISNNYTQPQPPYSAFREASFGHGIFDIKNRTHALFTWNRNQDGYAVAADSKWFFNRVWYPVDEAS